MCYIFARKKKSKIHIFKDDININNFNMKGHFICVRLKNMENFEKARI